MVGIYVLKTDCHYYIGLSSDLNKRKSQHLYHLKNNKHQNQLLQNIYNKGYNIEFEIIQECEIENLNRLEILWIELYGIMFPNKRCVNLKSGGNRPTYFYESKEKMSKSKMRKEYDLEKRYAVYKEDTDELLYVGTLLEISKTYKLELKEILHTNKIGYKNYWLTVIEYFEDHFDDDFLDYMIQC